MCEPNFKLKIIKNIFMCWLVYALVTLSHFGNGYFYMNKCYTHYNELFYRHFNNSKMYLMLLETKHFQSTNTFYCFDGDLKLSQNQYLSLRKAKNTWKILFLLFNFYYCSWKYKMLPDVKTVQLCYY